MATPVAIPGAVAHRSRRSTDRHEVNGESDQDTPDDHTDKSHRHGCTGKREDDTDEHQGNDNTDDAGHGVDFSTGSGLRSDRAHDFASVGFA
jgi:hypothetical protein